MLVAICAGDIEVLCSHEGILLFGIPQGISQNRCHSPKNLMPGQKRGLASSPLVI